MSFTFHRLLLVAVVLPGVLLGPGCDTGAGQLQKAEAQYADLVQRGVHPRDPAYDAVIAAFEAVPKDSRGRPEAEQRLAAILSLRGTLPPRPLATPAAEGPGLDALEAQRAACAQLAQELGVTEDARREAVRQALTECQAKLVRLEATSHPPGEEAGAHGPGGH
ncbi:hypothetical protein [Stigmatella erecta]|uniref:Uncharacterized protein n=1 Tax=Stigmatella erecta TaxID=83460 RepID=A0A1I0KKX8_9BACT|nr:hypothetical protein [Stigmatella erecta]SEU24781.1 hypothetical protein SAMN05443639_111132 [Stigmatella erecta]